MVWVANSGLQLYLSANTTLSDPAGKAVIKILDPAKTLSTSSNFKMTSIIVGNISNLSKETAYEYLSFIISSIFISANPHPIMIMDNGTTILPMSLKVEATTAGKRNGETNNTIATIDTIALIFLVNDFHSNFSYPLKSFTPYVKKNN